MVKIIDQKDRDAIKIAIKILKSGGIISFATDTIYALACDATNDVAVERLYKIKKRNKNKAISIMLPNINFAEKVFDFLPLEKKIVTKCFPGTLTLISKIKTKILTKNNCNISKLLNQNSNNYLGFRIPNDKFSLKLLESFNGIVAATSANLSGKNPHNNGKQIAKCFSKTIDLVVDGGNNINDIASTVVIVKDNKYVEILREGLLKKNDIMSLVN